MNDPLRRWLDRFRDAVWGTDPRERAPAAALAVRLARLTQAVALELKAGQLTLRAMGLVYTTLLSLVPLLAFSFSVLKALGGHNQLRPALLRFLAPLGDAAGRVTDQIIGFVQRVDVGVLGTVGVAFLVFTVIALIQKVEEAFNVIWRVRQARGFARRFSGYLSVLLVGPVLVFGALGLTATLMSASVTRRLLAVEPFGLLADAGARLVPYLLVIAAFAVTYAIIPNTRVRPSAALAGGVVAGLLWQTVGWGFGSFMVGSTKYTAIYSGFAILILFMVWLFLNWLILLVGAAVAFYAQHPEYQRAGPQTPEVGGRERERLALLVMHAVAHGHDGGEPPWTVEGLAARLRAPEEVIAALVEALAARGVLVATGQDPPGYVPARALERIPLAAVVAVAREAGDGAALPGPDVPCVAGVVARMEGGLAEALEGRTARDLVPEDGAGAGAKGAGAP